MKRWLLLAAVLPVAAMAADAEIPGFDPANSPAINGRAIAVEAARRDDGFGDSSAAMTMVLFDGRGNSVQRAMRSLTLEQSADGDRTILYFEDPADVRGTAFLTHSHAERPNDQWLYLPALRRVKRIASNQRSGAFMSSEFSYEDLGNDEVDKYTYHYIGEVSLDGVPCYHIERKPTDKSGYSRQEVWLDRDALRLQQVHYYDRRNALLKTLAVSDFTLHRERFWRPARMHMINVQTGRETVLTWEDYAFGQGLNAREFEPGALNDIR